MVVVVVAFDSGDIIVLARDGKRLPSAAIGTWCNANEGFLGQSDFQNGRIPLTMFFGGLSCSWGFQSLWKTMQRKKKRCSSNFLLSLRFPSWITIEVPSLLREATVHPDGSWTSSGGTDFIGSAAMTHQQNHATAWVSSGSCICICLNSSFGWSSGNRLSSWAANGSPYFSMIAAWTTRRNSVIHLEILLIYC